MPRPVVRAFFLVFMAIAVVLPQALACTFHMTASGSIFERTYPGSLNVVVAVAAARSEDRLSGDPLESGELGLMRASYELKKLGRRFGSADELPRVDFFLMFAGQQLWTYYRTSNFTGRPAYAVHVHSAEPVHDVPVVLTSYYVVLALQDGDMTFAEALDRGLIQIRNDKAGHVTAMFREAFKADVETG